MAAEPQQGRASGQRARERLLAATPLTARHETLAGVSTHILQDGEGPPMVLLHGQGEFWAVWLQVIDELVRGHQLVVVDLPGHGESTIGEGRPNAATMRRWLDELIDATCPAPPVLVGHLLGGAIAARYAVRHAGRLAHLVLVDTLGLSWFRPSPSFGIPMMRFIAHPTERSRDRLFRQCFLDFDLVGERFADHWDEVRTYALDRARTPSHQAAMRVLMPQVGVPAISRTELDRIDVPTTLIHGRHDLQVPLRVAERAAARHRWPLYVIEGARDDPAAEQPEALVATLLSALADRRSPSSEEAPS